MNYREHITSNSKVMLGKPCIKGTRITVELILEKLSDGMTIEKFIESYPHIHREDILAALAYAADMVANEAMIEITA
jgi:uncharacterized protein (DUF433 family)